ncbi:hypothetical protein MANES_18G112160v8 [Manihot esculenta]|uniref:Uncharacterized protein n=1 Tax=Manihot esculenta TaxID=3983 RepID=A0ACB7FZU4_MANES|nr:hypothetical protein MANES_18G112160v8 [Manihot esculenta]
MNKFDHLLLTCGSHLKNTDGNEMFLPFVAPEISHESMRMETTIESDHVFLWHNHYCSETRLIQKFSNVNELLMEFEFKAEHNMYSAGGARQLEVVKLKVKRCGVHLMYVSKDEEYQCSQSTIHSQHCLQYAATDSEFMQQVIETAHTNKKRSSDQANIITDGRLDKRLCSKDWRRTITSASNFMQQVIRTTGREAPVRPTSSQMADLLKRLKEL